MKSIYYFYKLIAVVLSLAFVQVSSLFAQTHLPECTSNVPFFNIDLSATPDSIYVTPDNVVRRSSCCETNDRYVSFYVTMHPDVAAFEIYEDGAPAFGSANYTIISGGDLTTGGDCGEQIPAGSSQCIVGPGPHKILYSKPGSNTVQYSFRQIPKPIFPDDQFTRVGCSKPINIYGLRDITIKSVNSSTGNTTEGAYNDLLSCTDCADPSFTPGLSTPEWIEYEVCGAQIASTVCGEYTNCGTFRVYTRSALNLTVDPNPASFCAGGTGVELTATPSGGDSDYFYNWTDSDGNNLSTNSNYTADEQGIYTIELGDGLNSPTCPSEFISVPVTVGQPPVVDAGPDQTVCAQNPTTFLAGSVENATGGVWSGGDGIFDPNPNSLLATYTPTQAEIANGSVELTLTSTGAGGGCTNDSDVMTISFSDTVKVEPIVDPIACFGGTTTIDANASGGTAPLSYIWSNGETTPTIDVSAGTYSVMVRDAIGCGTGTSISVTNPTSLSFETSTTLTSDNVTCDGTASVSVSGGTTPYTVTWGDGQDGLTATGICDINTFTIEDAAGCTVEGSVVVNSPLCSSLDLNLVEKEDVSCFGFEDGEAEVIASGGDGTYSYSWNSNPIQTTARATDLPAGTYEVTVTDGEGCQKILSVTILQPTVITNVMTSSDATSIGGTEGQATANPDGGTPDYNYIWTPTAQTTQTASNLSEGMYYVTILDDNGCIKLDSVFINQPPCNNFILAVDQSNISCSGSTDGSASVLIAHGTPPYSIEWRTDGGAIVANDVLAVSDLSAGSYVVEVEDASNCITFKTFDITEPSPLSIGLARTNVSCNGAADGTIDLTVSGGTFPYTFEWFVGTRLIATTEDLVNLAPNTYSVRVTDANGCRVEGSIGVSQPSVLLASLSVEDITCFGLTNGKAEATVSGGVLPYSVSWTGPNSFSSSDLEIEDLEDGLYSFQVTDGNLCDLTLPLEIFVNEPEVIEILDIDVPCPVPSETTVTVEVTEIIGGDGGPYQVSFDNGSTYNPIGNYTTVLEIGETYNVFAKDGNECTNPIAFNLDLNSNVVINDIIFDNCIPEGATTIPVEVIPSGGEGEPYQVSLNGGSDFQAAGEHIFNLAVGQSYDIVIKDSEECGSTVSTIVIPNELNVEATLEQQVSCIGESDGVVSILVTGGTSPYTYNWTSDVGFSSIEKNINGLAEGNYEVEVTDAFECKATTSIFVSTIPDVTDPVFTFCPTDQNEETDEDECTFTQRTNAWDPSATDDCGVVFLSAELTGVTELSGLTTLENVAFNLGTTTVTWTVTDGSGNTEECVFDVEVEDNEDPTFTACIGSDQTVETDEDECTFTQTSDAWDAIADDNCTVSTVTAELEYDGVVVASGLTTLENVVFQLGTTTVTWTVTDGSGNTEECVFDVVVEDNELPSITSCPEDIQSCDPIITYDEPQATDNCGIASVTRIAGLPSGSEFPVGITTVTYEFVDVNDNVSTCSFDVEIFETPDLTSEVDNVTCFGFDNGEIRLTMIAGEAPFTFEWDNDEEDQNLTNLSPGIYTVKVIDANECTTSQTFEITQPDELNVEGVVSDVLCYGAANGSIGVEVSGGFGSYSFEWDNGETTQNISNLEAGTYELTVRDENLCELIIPFTVSQPDSMYATYSVENATCGASNGNVLIEHFGGVPPYSYKWSNETTEKNLSNVASGEYVLVITDGNECTYEVTVEVGSDSNLTATVVVSDATCYGRSDGTAVAIVDAGAAPYSYLWSNGETTPKINELAAGEYTVTIRDAFECEKVVSFEVFEPELIDIVLTSPDQGNGFNVTPFGSSNGTITSDVIGGTEPYEYDWTTGDSTPNITGLSAGTYTLLVTDKNGCISRESITLNQPDMLEMPSGISPNNDGKNDYFVIRGVEAYPENEITIFNRWGNLVYQKNNYANEWEGQNNKGEPLPDGTYFVVFHAFTPDGAKTLKGYVDLRR